MFIHYFNMLPFNASTLEANKPVILVHFFLDAPLFVEDKLPDSIKVAEGETLSLDGSVDAKPVASSYKWQFDGEVITSTAVLNISSITKAQNGEYTVIATNSEGSAEKTIIVHVKCKFVELYNIC